MTIRVTSNRKEILFGQFERIISRIYRDTGDPARTVTVAVEYGYLSTPMVRIILGRMEKAGRIERVGERGGWLPAGKLPGTNRD